MHSLSPSAAPSKPAPPGSGDKRNTLLIVDDEEGPRQSLRIVFKDEYDVLVAESGPRALELLRGQRVDAAVLDIRMAGMSGTDLLGRIKSIDPAVEVVMLTAYETIDTMRQSLRHGACDYLTKPFDVTTMRAAVARAMQRRMLADELRATEQELRRLRDEIERERMQAEMARQKGEIYASVIHDLNNPLTVIAGVIELINGEMTRLTNLGGESLSTVRQHLSQISRQVTSCSDISRRYLGFLRQRNMGNVHVSTNQVLADMQALLRNHRLAQGNQLTLHPLADDVDALVNGTDMIQILLNLVTNAFQSGASPVHVVVSAALSLDPSAEVSMKASPGETIMDEGYRKEHPTFVWLTVADDGPGMLPEVLSRVFEPYFTTRETTGGSGLGLSIVARLVKSAGGLVHVRSTSGRGTVFSIFLPCCASQSGGTGA